MLLWGIKRGAVICHRSSTICSFIWKQWIIWLTSVHLRDSVFLAYIGEASHVTVLVDLPGSGCQLLPRSPNETLGSGGKKESHPKRHHSFRAERNQANLEEFSHWLHILLQEMEMINSHCLCCSPPRSSEHRGFKQRQRNSLGADHWIWAQVELRL